MLKKISLIASVLAALGLAIASPADAAPKKGKTVVHVTRTTHVTRTVHRTVRVGSPRRNFVMGRRYGNNVWYGQKRHFWHGQWYGYGVGPCWVNVDGLWFWNVLACP